MPKNPDSRLRPAISLCHLKPLRDALAFRPPARPPYHPHPQRAHRSISSLRCSNDRLAEGLSPGLIEEKSNAEREGAKVESFPSSTACGYSLPPKGRHAAPASRFRITQFVASNAMRVVHPRQVTVENEASPPRIDLHGARHAGGQYDAFGYLIDMDAHRDALGQPHPGEDRIDAPLRCRWARARP